jgi:Protein of unknown function (DUF2442)
MSISTSWLSFGRNIMTEHRIITTDQEIKEAFERAKLLQSEPRAKTVEYIQRLNMLIVQLSNGRRLLLPIEELQGLQGATHKQIKNCKLVGRGTGITWPDLDADLYVPALIDGVYGTKRWMAALGRKGGSATTEAKQAASRANGAKGGRPKKRIGAQPNDRVRLISLPQSASS